MSNKKLIINTSNLVMGGAIQVAQSVLYEFSKLDSNYEFYVFLSEKVKVEIEDIVFPRNFHFFLIENKPKPFWKGKAARRELSALEAKIKPDAVLSIFGPVYWTPKCKHIAGFASGWAINPQSIAYDVLDLKTKLKIKLTNFVKLWYVNQPEADEYIVETNVVKKLFAKYSRVSKGKIHVVTNTFGDQYNQETQPCDVIKNNYQDFFKFITIASNYPHKNLKSIRLVLPILHANNIQAKFFVTLPDSDYASLFAGCEHDVINLGVIKANDCPSYYKACDAMYLPTLLESFTASYPEAMKMQLPILTSDLDFARGLCGDAALYCDTNAPQDVYEKMNVLLRNKELRSRLTDNGLRKLGEFDSSESRALKYLSICFD